MAQQIAQVGRRRRQAGADALQGARQALRFHRLEQVVDRAGVEGVHRILVVGGHEYHVRALADAGGHFQARQARHADIEEHHVGLMLQEAVPGIVAILGHLHDARVRPGRGQHGQQALAHQRFVFGDQYFGAHQRSAFRSRGIRISATKPPSSASSSESRAASP